MLFFKFFFLRNDCVSLGVFDVDFWLLVGEGGIISEFLFLIFIDLIVFVFMFVFVILILLFLFVGLIWKGLGLSVEL